MRAFFTSFEFWMFLGGLTVWGLNELFCRKYQPRQLRWALGRRGLRLLEARQLPPESDWRHKAWEVTCESPDGRRHVIRCLVGLKGVLFAGDSLPVASASADLVAENERLRRELAEVREKAQPSEPTAHGVPDRRNFPLG